MVEFVESRHSLRAFLYHSCLVLPSGDLMVSVFRKSKYFWNFGSFL